VNIQGVPLATEPGISLIILTPMKILQRNFEQEYVRCVRNEEECVCGVHNIYIYIQGVPGGMCQNSGECSLS